MKEYIVKEYTGTLYHSEEMGEDCYGRCMDENWFDIFEELADKYDGKEIQIMVKVL